MRVILSREKNELALVFDGETGEALANIGIVLPWEGHTIGDACMFTTDDAGNVRRVNICLGDGGAERFLGAVAQAIIAMKKMRDAGLSTYRCPICGGWHVGHSRANHKV